MEIFEESNKFARRLTVPANRGQFLSALAAVSLTGCTGGGLSSISSRYPKAIIAPCTTDTCSGGSGGSGGGPTLQTYTTKVTSASASLLSSAGATVFAASLDSSSNFNVSTPSSGTLAAIAPSSVPTTVGGTLTVARYGSFTATSASKVTLPNGSTLTYSATAGTLTYFDAVSGTSITNPFAGTNCPVNTIDLLLAAAGMGIAVAVLEATVLSILGFGIGAVTYLRMMASPQCITES